MNRASRYIPFAGSQAAGAPGSSIGMEVKNRDGASNTALYAANGTAVGHDPQTGIMIPTLVTRHRVKRPAMSMEGGTKNISYGAARPAAVCSLPLKKRDTVRRKPQYMAKKDE